MGYQDRDYWQNDSEGWRGSSASSWGGTARSLTVTLILINVAVFFLDMFTDRTGPGVHWLGQMLALNSDDWQRPWMWWRLVSYGFVHAPFDAPNGFLHIFGNMLALFFLGRTLESDYGRSEFLKFYLMAIVIAGLVWVATTYSAAPPRSVVGASGGVAAVLVLFAFRYPRVNLLVFGIWPVPAWILATFLVGMDIVRSFNKDSLVAAQCHLAGAGFAALYYRLKWNFQWLAFGWLARLTSRRRQLRVYREADPLEDLRRQADEVLDKINRSGEASLTRRERKILEQYSEKLRNHEL
ncbi:MAG TPA: rhomboid family intramembrane serine protease [Pirellulaceae bacterium]|nr:rhomboid family intramembrane serine protease [Pirellulaceae bacterium]